jgi:hypothetical protein
MRLYVHIDATCSNPENKVSMQQKSFEYELPQLVFMQVGAYATPIKWEGHGKGIIPDFEPGSTIMLPLTLMAQTDGVQTDGSNHMDCMNQNIDCFHTTYVESKDVQTRAIKYGIQHGPVYINVLVSPIEHVNTDRSLPNYCSPLVENTKLQIEQGNFDTQLCLAMLTTGLNRQQATSILHSENVNVHPDQVARVRKLGYVLLKSETKASTGLPSMHHTTITHTLDCIQSKLPINMKLAFSTLMQARKYCLDLNIPMNEANLQDMTKALQFAVQVIPAIHTYKYDTTLGTIPTQLNNQLIFPMDKNTDIQHATLEKTASHVLNDHKQLAYSKQMNASLSTTLQVNDEKADCEDFAWKGQRLAAHMQAPCQLVDQGHVSTQDCHDIVQCLFTEEGYVCCTPEIELATKECMLLSKAMNKHMKIKACIGLAGAANLSEAHEHQHAFAVSGKTRETLETLMSTKRAAGHSWGLGTKPEQANAPLHFTDPESNCSIRVQLLTGDIVCYEGTGVAITDPNPSLQQDVQFKLETNLQMDTSSSAFQSKILQLNNKVMPQFMAVSLASSIHQTVLANAYEFCAKPVSTQPSMSGFYKAVIAMNDDNTPCTMFQTSAANAVYLQNNPTLQGLKTFMQNTTIGYIPGGNDMVTVQVAVQPLNQTYSTAIDCIAESLATRILHPQQQEAHYKACMQKINLQHGVNMPLSPYTLNLMAPLSKFPPESTSLKFIARTNTETVKQMIHDKTIKTYVSISPFAHLCSL